MSTHDAVEVIIAKRDRGELSDSQIDWVVDAYTRGEVADEQMASLAMAILLNGMNRREIAPVQRAISRRFMPRSRMAIASADICSSATAPRVYAPITQSICGSVSS